MAKARRATKKKAAPPGRAKKRSTRKGAKKSAVSPKNVARQIGGVVVLPLTARAPAAVAFAPSTTALTPLVAPTASLSAAPATLGRILNCEPSLGGPSPQSAAQPTAAPPASDYRSPGWPVGEQGFTGACVGFAVGDGLLRWYFRKTGQLAPQEGLSVRYFWMAAKEMDEYRRWPTTFVETEGTSIYTALKIATDFGCLKDIDLPVSGPLYQRSLNEFLAAASLLKINQGAVQAVERNPVIWAEWIHKYGPLAARINVDGTFISGGNHGVLQTVNFAPSLASAGHAVVLVGYQPAEDRFIIRNSWGRQWGDDGFAYADAQYLMSIITETWGVY